MARRTLYRVRTNHGGKNPVTTGNEALRKSLNVTVRSNTFDLEIKRFFLRLIDACSLQGWFVLNRSWGSTIGDRA